VITKLGLCRFVCGHKILTQQRQKVVPLAKGHVLEIGFGTGLNLGFYDPEKVDHVWGLDRAAAMWQMADVAAVPFGVEFIRASAESIPYRWIRAVPIRFLSRTPCAAYPMSSKP